MFVKFNIIDKNKIFSEKKLKALLGLKGITKDSVKVGIPSNKEKHTKKRGSGGKIVEAGGPNVSVLEIAAANEFGTKTIPERSFLRSTVRKNQSKYKKLGLLLVENLLKKTTEEEYKKELGKLGLIAQSDVQETIRKLKDPPNALSTQLKKGRSLGKGSTVDNPLIDTGQLIQSITFVVNDKD